MSYPATNSGVLNEDQICLNAPSDEAVDLALRNKFLRKNMALTIQKIEPTSRKAKVLSKAGDISASFDNHLTFRMTIRNLSKNTCLQQIPERIIISLYALCLIQQSDSVEGILQTTTDCIDHQYKILTACGQKRILKKRGKQHAGF